MQSQPEQPFREQIYSFVDFILERQKAKQYFKQQIESTINHISHLKQQLIKKQSQLHQTQIQTKINLIDLQEKHQYLIQQLERVQNTVNSQQKALNQLNESIRTQEQQQLKIIEQIKQNQNSFQTFITTNELNYKRSLQEQFELRKECLITQYNLNSIKELLQQTSQIREEHSNCCDILTQKQQQFTNSQKQCIKNQALSEEWEEIKQELIKRVQKLKGMIVNDQIDQVSQYLHSQKQRVKLTHNDKIYKETNYFDMYTEALNHQSRQIKGLLTQLEQQYKRQLSVMNQTVQ